MHRREWLWVASVVLFTAFFGFASAQTPDSETPANEGICDDLQSSTPGLYGLCVAYCEAQDCAPDFSLENPWDNCRPGSQKVLDRYNAKKTAADPDMPCLVAGACPCFTQEELESFPPQPAGVYADCDSMLPVTKLTASADPFITAEVNEQLDPATCLYFYEDGNGPGANVLRSEALTAEQAAACRGAILLTIESSPYCQ